MKSGCELDRGAVVRFLVHSVLVVVVDPGGGSGPIVSQVRPDLSGYVQSCSGE